MVDAEPHRTELDQPAFGTRSAWSAYPKIAADYVRHPSDFEPNTHLAKIRASHDDSFLSRKACNRQPIG
ncbi:hypothetical protein A0U90_00430 [Kozakia baliensis]|nr:hypothetical protein A0U90_00430 [Kozakia baliensis]